MPKEPHLGGILDKYPYVVKDDVVGRVVCLLDARSENRGMELVIHPSRAVPRGQIHELVLTDQAEAAPGGTVDRVAYVGFFEVEHGGLILVGDRVTVDGQELGRVAGFNETHFPNHMNVLLKAPVRQTGVELGVKLGAKVVFRMAEQAAHNCGIMLGF